MMGDGVNKTYGLFVDTPGTVTFDVGYTDIDQLIIVMENENYKIYLIEGETYQDVVREFRKMIGRAILPPDGHSVMDRAVGVMRRRMKCVRL